MINYRLNPYVSFIESRLLPGSPQRAVFHRLTGEIIEPNEIIYSLLSATKTGNRLSLDEADIKRLGEHGTQLKELIQKEFLISENYDPLTVLRDHYVTRPIQNPALAYLSRTGEWILVRTSMEHTVYSRKRDELPLIIEEILPSLTADIFQMADGTTTLQEIFANLRGTDKTNILHDSEFRKAIDFLTSQNRQLIKLTRRVEDLRAPFSRINIVPRNLYHSERWDAPQNSNSVEPIIDFHLKGIEDAGWEFDLIEPTVNHSFRFPHEALGGLDYASRFCLSTLQPEVLPLFHSSNQLEVLEIGGGTGSFARSFIEQARSLTNINYHILDLSPALIESQRKVLFELLPEGRHFQQDATEFDIPGREFDLIIANEVIADFPIAPVQRTDGNDLEGKDAGSQNGQKWEGDGAYYMDKYNLSDKDAPESFLINAGAFRFIERAWRHLKPGGTLVISEYGAEHRYPVRSFHLNHDEFSIHFGHLAACAAKIGFQCRLVTLKDFLSFDDELPVLDGREEHILCLNYILKSFGVLLPYAVISKSDFERRCQEIVEAISLTGYSFSPLSNQYHFGPNIEDFLVLIMNKPVT